MPLKSGVQLSCETLACMMLSIAMKLDDLALELELGSIYRGSGCELQSLIKSYFCRIELRASKPKDDSK